MDDDEPLVLKVLEKVLVVLRKLSPDQLARLADGRGGLTFVDAEAPRVQPGGAAPAGNAFSLTPEQLRQYLGSMRSRQEAAEYLTAGRINKDQLRTIASSLGLATRSKELKQDLVDRIVEETLGFRLSYEAIARNQH